MSARHSGSRRGKCLAAKRRVTCRMGGVIGHGRRFQHWDVMMDVLSGRSDAMDRLLLFRQVESNMSALFRPHVAAKQLADGGRLDDIETHLPTERTRLPVLRTGNRVGHHALDGVRSADVDHRERRDGSF